MRWLTTGKRRLWALAVALLVTVTGALALATVYTNWLWFQSLDLESVYLRMVHARLLAGGFFGLLAVLLIGPNLAVARRNMIQVLQGAGSPAGVQGGPVDPLLRARAAYLVAGAVLVVVMARIGSGQWLLWLRFLNDQPFALTDPIFALDIGYYVFELPFLRFLASFLLGSVIVSMVAVSVVYMSGGAIRFQETIVVLPRPGAHLSVLGALFLLALAWVYRLKIFGLLYSDDWVAFGAGYVDANIQVFVYWLLVLMYMAAGTLFLINARPTTGRGPLLAGVGLVVAAILLGIIPSSLAQTFLVEPNELAREAPYIRHNLEATRRAYGLDRIEEQTFAVEDQLTAADIQANPLTIRNVRIWDERPLVQTYQQVQEIRPYYVFPEVDVDRYTVDGVYTQVMLSAREMAADRLPIQARSWVNERLQYTHGYGVAMSPVNRVTPGGLPELLVRDLPPVSAPGLEIDRPEIYYGEKTRSYVMTNTSTQEFDYPKGSENVFSTYQGTGGVSIGGLLGRIAFALRLGDLNLILSDYITGESRVMFRRQIEDRVRTLAPFLQYDTDPYMVVSEGRLYWVMDAYTTTDMYPYSSRGGRSLINYIRNSVKVVVDAYNGSAVFYRMNEEDPLIAAYAEIFPGLFRPVDEMSQDLRQHLRYPRDMFKYQAMIYRSYHMQDVHVFYNQEDLWSIPNELYHDRPQLMEPYYIIVRLPGEEHEEFMLMVPFTPARKDNMIGWLAARCDADSYGDLLLYQLPKDRLIYGPMQIEARIDQQPEIASQLTLWGQKGSEVIRGNLLVIPIEKSFLYVEPVYLQASQPPQRSRFSEPGATGRDAPPQARARPGTRSTAIPELKQVIVAFGGQVIMRSSFEEALAEMFGMEPELAGAPDAPDAADAAETTAEQEVVPGGNVPGTAVVLQTAAQMVSGAEAHFRGARAALQEWDWSRAGEELDALESALSELRDELNQEP